MMNNDMTNPPLGRSPTGETNIERIVMRRVRIIRILGLIISTGVFAGLALVATLWGIGREVWVARVFENAPHDFISLLRFYVDAFLNTRVLVQTLVLATLASLTFLAREIIRLLFDFFAPPRS